MKNTSIAKLFCALAVIFPFLPIDVRAFGLGASSTTNGSSKPSTFVLRMQQGRQYADSLGLINRVNDACVSPITRTILHKKESNSDGITKQNFPSRHRKAQNCAIRSSLASLFAAALVTSSSIEIAKAESIAPTTPFIETNTVAVSSSTASAPSMEFVSSSAFALAQEESAGSLDAGNIILYAWIGISGYAGIKGVVDISKRNQEEQQE
jgi:hypothetical protein